MSLKMMIWQPIVLSIFILVSASASQAQEDSTPSNVRKAALAQREAVYKRILAGSPKVTKDEIVATLELMERAVKAHPEDAELLRQTGQFYYDIQSFPKAVQCFEDLKALANSASTKQSQFSSKDLLRYVDCLVRCKTDETDAKASAAFREMLGIDTETGKPSTSKATYPQLIDGYTLLMKFQLQNRNDRPAAVAALDQLVRANPKNAQAWFVRSKVLSVAAGKRVDTSKDLQRAFQLDPDNPEIVMAVARATSAKRPDYAKQLLKDTLKKPVPPRLKPKMQMALVEILIVSKETEDADQQLDIALNEFPRDPDLLFSKARLSLETIQAATDVATAKQQSAELQELVKRLQSLPGLSQVYAGFLVARFKQVREKDLVGAIEIFEKIQPHAKQRLAFEIDVYLTDLYAQNKQFDKALVTSNKMVSAGSSIPKIQEAHLRLLISMKRNTDAIDYIKQVESLRASQGQPLSPNFKMARAGFTISESFKEGAPARTPEQREALEKYIKSVVGDTGIPKLQRLLLAMRYFEGLGDKKKAISAIESALQIQPGSMMLWALRLDKATEKAEADQLIATMKERVNARERVHVYIAAAKVAIKFELASSADEFTKIAKEAAQLPANERAFVLGNLAQLAKAFANKNEQLGKLAPVLIQQATAAKQSL